MTRGKTNRLIPYGCDVCAIYFVLILIIVIADSLIPILWTKD